jgi:branched-chain amino acid aminotransferase
MLQKFNPKNEDLKIWVGDGLHARQDAKVSVFDSSVQGGDAVWEGLRVYDGKIFSLDQHLNRLIESAHALAFENVPDVAYIKKAIFETLAANNMRDGVHIRLTLTRGEKITSGMDPRLNTKGCTLIVLAEWKPPVYEKEMSLVTASIRRNSPLYLDSKIHHANLLNNILAKIEANLAGVDEAIMLDQHGFVSECNSVNIFMIKNGKVYTPYPDNCLPGITRGLVIDIARENGIKVEERNLTVTEFYNADEVFTTGTMGELVKVVKIDGRVIKNRFGDSVFARLKEYFGKQTEIFGEPLPGE